MVDREQANCHAAPPHIHLRTAALVNGIDGGPGELLRGLT